MMVSDRFIKACITGSCRPYIVGTQKERKKETQVVESETGRGYVLLRDEGTDDGTYGVN